MQVVEGDTLVQAGKQQITGQQLCIFDILFYTVASFDLLSFQSVFGANVVRQEVPPSVELVTHLQM